MSFKELIEENEIRITGVMLGESKDFDHRENLRTLTISAKSFCKSFYEDERKSRKEHVMVELHDRAAEKAKDYQARDILHIRGQLSVRKWVDSHQNTQIRLVVVVDDHRKINRTGVAESKLHEQPTE